MLKKRKYSSKLIIIVLGIFFISSCSYNKTVIELNSFFDSTWDFNSASNYTFDTNSVEVVNGKASLKKLDLEHSGDDFDNGNHVGTHVFGPSLQVDIGAKETPEIVPVQNINLIGHWPLHVDSLSTVNNQNDAISFGNPSFASPSQVANSSLVLSGGQHLEVPNNDTLQNLSSFSFSVWARANSKGNFRAIFSKSARNNSNQSFRLALNASTDQKLRFRIVTNVTNYFIESIEPFPIDKWTHVAGKYDGSSLKLFIDGIEQGTVATSGVLNSFSDEVNPLSIGVLGSTFGRYWDGNIEEFALWNNSLADHDLISIYKSQAKNFTELSSNWTPKYDNIVGYWKMDGNWQDSSGNGNHGMATVEPSFTGLSKKVGTSAGLFSGAGANQVEFSDSTYLSPGNDDFSLHFWFRSNKSDHTDLSSLYSDWSSSGGELNCYIHSSEFLACHVNDGTGLFRAIDNTTFVNDQLWHHVTFVRRGQTLSLFLDGKLLIKNDHPTMGSVVTNTDRPPCIGARGANCFSSSGLHLFEGEMDDVAFFRSSLSDYDISLIYNRQKQKYAGSYDSEVMDLGSITSNWPDLSWLTSLPFGKELVGDFDNDGNPDSESSSDYPGLTSGLSNGLIGYWNFNEKTLDLAPDLGAGNNDFNDQSGNDNHLFEAGGVQIAKSGILADSVEFDGLNDLIKMDSALADIEGHDTGTVSLWFKSSNLGSGSALFTMTESVGTDNFMQLWLGNIGTGFSDESLVFSLKSSGSQKITMYVRNGENYYLDGEWHQLVLRIDGVQNTIFVDGVKQPITFAQGSITTNEFSNISNAKSISLGARTLSGTTGHYYSGQMDEVAFWSRGLSDTEIQNFYRRVANRVKFQLKSCVDSSCECKSYEAGGSETDCDGDTIVNALDNDDEHKAEFIGPGGDGTTFYSELYSRQTIDVTFNCALNTSDSNPGVCVEDEITLTGGPKPTGPEFLNIDYTQFVNPNPNRYAQYRVYMEADENTACNGEPCLPELTSVSLNPSGVDKYIGGPVEIKPTSSITYKSIRGIIINADACATYQLSDDGAIYNYWDGSAWSPITAANERTTKLDLENNIVSFGSQFGPGKLFIKSFLESNPDQTSNCTINDIDVNYVP